MTREEAIDILKHDISLDKQGIEYCHDALGIEALEMAINSLEQEPKTESQMSDKWINLKEVIKVLTKNRVHFYDMVEITSELKELPPVTPKLKTGYWKRHCVPTKSELWWECSECKHALAQIEKTKYCPNCGAKMESEDKE